MAQHFSGDTPPIIRSSKTVIAASGFTYVFGCRLPLQWLSHRSGNRQPKTYAKPEAEITVFELLMMGGVSPETCWAIKKRWNNKFFYTVASCWFFLWDLYYDARIHLTSTVFVIGKPNWDRVVAGAWCFNNMARRQWIVLFYSTAESH